VDGGGGETECERLGVGSMSNVSGVGSVGLGHENNGHRFLARLEVRHCSQQESRLDVEERRCRRETYYEEGSVRVHSRVGWRRRHGRRIGEQGKSDVGCILRLHWRRKWAW